MSSRREWQGVWRCAVCFRPLVDNNGRPTVNALRGPEVFDTETGELAGFHVACRRHRRVQTLMTYRRR